LTRRPSLAEFESAGLIADEKRGQSLIAGIKRETFSQVNEIPALKRKS
jgi:hypothetical protein